MSWTICVSNPSPYERNNYVEVNQQKLGVPPQLNESNLRLFRIKSDQYREKIPFQIDSVLGHDSPVRILTFLSTQIPASAEALLPVRNLTLADRCRKADPLLVTATKCRSAGMRSRSTAYTRPTADAAGPGRIDQ